MTITNYFAGEKAKSSALLGEAVPVHIFEVELNLALLNLYINIDADSNSPYLLTKTQGEGQWEPWILWEARKFFELKLYKKNNKDKYSQKIIYTESKRKLNNNNKTIIKNLMKMKDKKKKKREKFCF